MKNRLTRVLCLLIIMAVTASSIYGLAVTSADIQLSKIEITSEYTRVDGVCFEISDNISLSKNNVVLGEEELPTDGKFSFEAQGQPARLEFISGGKNSELDLSGFSELFSLENESYNSFSLKMENEKFVFSGKHSGNTGTYITMTILDENGKIKAIDEKRSDENGSFSYEFFVREGSYIFDLKAEELSGIQCEINMPEIDFGANSEDFEIVVSELSECAAELEDLREQCRNKGFTTDYEDVNIEIIKKFIGYLYEENELGYSGSVGQYYYALKKLYRQAKADMTAYLNGERVPFDVPKYVTSDLSFEGENLFATAETEKGFEKRPVFFNGFGHFDTAFNDIEFFSNIGLNVIQCSLPSLAGCVQLDDIPDYWDGVRAGGSTAEFKEASEESAEGKYSLKAESNDAWQMNRIHYITQGIDVKSETTYVIKFKSKGIAVNENSLVATFDNVHTGTKYGIAPSDNWTEHIYEYTTAADENIINLCFIIINKMQGMYIDDVSVCEKGTDENLVKNGDFERGAIEKTDIDRDAEAEGYYIRYNSLDAFGKILENAEKNNVLVDVGVFPHFLPEFIGQGIPSDYTDDGLNEMLFTPFKLNDEGVRKLISIYARLVGSIVSDYDCVYSICLMNEPGVLANKITENINLKEYYTPAWYEYLAELYENDISRLNYNHGASYGSFEEVDMPDDMEATPLYYDYRCFNDKLLADFHKWFAEEFRKYYPQYKIHTKIQDYFRGNYETYLERGTNYELIAPYMDINGCDAISSYASPTAKVSQKMAWYDFMTSVKDAPVFDTEAHILSDGAYVNYHSEHIRHSSADVWNGAVHGRGAAIYWLWDRSDTTLPWSENSRYTHSNFALRPEETAAIARANLDLNRLSREVAALQREKAKSAIFYSRTSAGYSQSYMKELDDAYKSLIFSGQKVDFITDSKPEAVHGYELVVISGATNVSEGMIRELKAYLNSGGHILIKGNASLKNNEYNKPHIQADIDYIYGHENTAVNGSTLEVVNNLGLSEIQLSDADGNELNDVEWSYAICGGKLVVNVMNYDESGRKYINVLYKGERIEKLDELRSGEALTEIELKPFEPLLLSIELFSFDLMDENGNVVDNDIDSLECGTIRCNSSIEGDLVLALYKDGALEKMVIGKNEIDCSDLSGNMRLMATVWDMDKMKPVTQCVNIYN